MASKVIIIGEKCQGVIEFEKAKDAKDFYFNTNLGKVNYMGLVHDIEPYKQRDELELK